MKDEKKILEHLSERAEFYDTRSPGQVKATEEYVAFVTKTVEDNKNAQIRLDAELNQYDRQHISYFALAVSFIVAGMLASPPSNNPTGANKFFYFAAIATALIAAALLCLEAALIRWSFRGWSEHTYEANQYIASDKWSTPTELGTWLDSHNSKVKPNSPQFVFWIESFMIPIAFILVICWVAEITFNPNWPFF